jgi:hypothetical protein
MSLLLLLLLVLLLLLLLLLLPAVERLSVIVNPHNEQALAQWGLSLHGGKKPLRSLAAL